MTYTKQERRIIHKMLVGAKQYLWDGNRRTKVHLNNSIEKHICYAVGEFAANNQLWGRSLVKTMIENRLVDSNGKKYRCIDTWLKFVAKIPEEQLTCEAVQTYRHEWVDHLIKEFSE